MKKILSALFFMILITAAMAQNNLSTDKESKQICSFQIKDEKIALVEKQNPQLSFENGDKTKFYRTELSAIVEHKNKQPEKRILDSALCVTKEYHKTMLPCVLIDTSQGLIYIFSNSKSPDFSYGMNGYVYRSDLSLDIIKKEIVFQNVNAGWSSFFGGSFRGNPELWHYSAAGGLVILSKRRGNNQWTNDIVGDINPKLVEDQYSSHKNVLFATLPNMDSMKFY